MFMHILLFWKEIQHMVFIAATPFYPFGELFSDQLPDRSSKQNCSVLSLPILDTLQKKKLKNSQRLK